MENRRGDIMTCPYNYRCKGYQVTGQTCNSYNEADWRFCGKYRIEKAEDEIKIQDGNK
jgi:hypothetical protein